VSVGRSGELVGEISAASVEQAQGIEQVNEAVGEMDKVVQQNAANAEESASASEEMNSQAEQMKSFVSELVVLVGGASGSQLRSSASSERATKTLMKSVVSAAKSSHFTGKNGNGKGNGNQIAHYAKKPLSAEQVFPLDDAAISQF
jgi:methyl-accepting chemotaxis protein